MEQKNGQSKQLYTAEVLATGLEFGGVCQPPDQSHGVNACWAGAGDSAWAVLPAGLWVAVKYALITV